MRDARILFGFIVLFLLPVFAHASVVNRSVTSEVTSGLIGYWTFDGRDILNGTLLDQSRQGNHGYPKNISTSTFYTVGKIGQAGNFDGINDNVLTTTISLIPTLGSPHSEFAWVYPTANLPNTYGVISYGEFDDTAFTTALGISGNKVAWLENGDQSSSAEISTTLTVPTQKWSLIGFVRTASTVTLYLNGASETINNPDANAIASDPILIGSTARNGAVVGFFPGRIDDARVYTRALSIAEITTLYNLGNQALRVNSTRDAGLTPDLLGYWTFDGPDINSTTAFDRSGNNFSGTLNSFPTLSSALVIGKKGQALFFDGVDDNISLGDVVEPSTITLAAWVKPALVKGGMKIISKKMSSSNPQYGIATAGGNIDKFTSSFFSSAASSDVCESTGAAGTYSANKWYFVAATYDGDVCKMYVNGVDTTNQISDNAAGGIQNTTSPLRIGADGGAAILAGSFFNGSIDDAKVYNRAMSATEILKLYNSSASAFGVNTSKDNRATTNLVGLWSFDGPDMLTNVADKSGQGNNGSFETMGATSSAIGLGKIGQALRFNGNGDVILPSSAAYSFSNANNFTVSVWIKPTSVCAATPCPIFDTQDGGGNLGYTLTRETNGMLGVIVRDSGGNAATLFSGPTVPVNAWSYVTYTFIGPRFIKFWINGVFVDSGTLALDLAPSVTNAYLGYNPNINHYFNGLMDDVRVYNTALSTSSIQTLYNLGR